MDKIFSAAIASFAVAKGSCLALACSGGPDSMALALLARTWAQASGMKLVALTVDHGLRKESAQEARQVSAWLKARGIAHTILTWKGRKPTRNVQEAARGARYRLMADYCKANGIAQLLVAHHLEDQAETFLLRLARGSGVDGLSAMSPRTSLFGITVLRPLLGVTKAQLLAYLKAQKQNFVNDPSNEDEAYDRVRLRALMPHFAKAGLSPQRLARTAANMARARAHLEEETGRFIARSCPIHAEGYATLLRLPTSEEIALRVLSTLIMIVGGQEVKTRLDDLTRLYNAMKGPKFSGATLGGCIFTTKLLKARGKGHEANVLLILREPKAVSASIPIKKGQTLLWDNRFEVSCLMPHASVSVGALGEAGWLFVARQHKISLPCPDKRILYTLPALRDKTGWIHAVPHLGLAAEGVKAQATFIVPA